MQIGHFQTVYQEKKIQVSICFEFLPSSWYRLNMVISSNWHIHCIPPSVSGIHTDTQLCRYATPYSLSACLPLSLSSTHTDPEFASFTHIQIFLANHNPRWFCMETTCNRSIQGVWPDCPLGQKYKLKKKPWPTYPGFLSSVVNILAVIPDINSRVYECPMDQQVPCHWTQSCAYCLPKNYALHWFN